MVYTDLYTAVKLNGWEEDQTSGAELTVNDFNKLNETEDYIINKVNRTVDHYGETYSSSTIKDLNPNIFQWLSLMDLNVWIILGLMLIVAGVTMISGLLIITYTKLVNPEAMLWGRLRVLVMTIALWAVYRMIPCRITKMVRIIAQMALLAWWYPDTYEINRMFPNLDHIFAGWEQDLFGCQPALLFAKALPWAVVSELMSMGYQYSR